MRQDLASKITAVTGAAAASAAAATGAAGCFFLAMGFHGDKDILYTIYDIYIYDIYSRKNRYHLATKSAISGSYFPILVKNMKSTSVVQSNVCVANVG